MRQSRKLMIINRRDALVGGAAAMALLSLVRPLSAAGPGAPVTPSLFEQALDKILGDAKATPSKMEIELPEIAENGNTVPYSITIASPMTPADHVKAIHVLASANPLANVASFHLTPMSGKAVVASRMRLARTQEITILAALSTNKFIVARRTVKVTIGGCGG